MKQFFFSLLISVALLSGAGVEWKNDYQGALKEAKATNKPVLLFFTGSDWCGWCKKLDKEVFQTDDFAKSAGGGYIFVELDYPMSGKIAPEVKVQNEALKAKYGINAYPTVILIDGNEHILGKTGYQAGGAKAYADHLKALVK